MSKSIEERVVQMEFENESFEKKASQSTKTLEKLDDALKLKNGTKSFADVEEAAEKTNFSSFIKATDTVTSRLSNLGVVGTAALTNITNKAIDAGTKLVKSLSVDQITAGWSKMDQITKATGTLISQGYDISEVESQLDRLNWFTDETSYNLTDMVDNISKFTATGKGLNDSATAMEGIALWAALSGQNASTASRAMYQLAQALGAGYMRLEDYKSIQNASMDTDEFRQKTINAAIALGTLQDNLDGTYTAIETGVNFTKSSFAQSLTEGAWFTSDVMMKVFQDYSTAVDQIYEYSQKKGITASQAIEELGDSVDEFGMKAFKAGQEARTFGDAINSAKDAVSTKWANTFKLIFGNYDQQRKLWTNLSEDLYTLFAEPLDNRNELLKKALTSNADEVFVERIKAAGVEYERFKEILIDTATQHDISIDSMTSDATSFEELLSQNWLSGDLFSEAINKYSENLTTTGKTVLTAEEQLAETTKIVNEIFNGDWGNGSERIERLTAAGYDAAKMQSYVNKVYNYGKLSLKDFSDTEVESVVTDEEKINSLKALSEEALNAGDAFNDLAKETQKPSGNELFMEGLSNMITAVIDRVTLFREIMSNMFPGPTAEQIYSIIERFHQLTESIQLTEDEGNKITSIFSGLFQIIRMLVSVSTEFISSFTPLLRLVSYFGGVILNLLSKIGEKINSFLANNNYTNMFAPLKNLISSIVDLIITLFDTLGRFGDFIKETYPNIGIFQTFGGILSSFAATTESGFNDATNSIQAFSNRLKKLDSNSFKRFTNKIIECINKFRRAIEKLWSYIEPYYTKLKSVLEQIGKYLSTYVVEPLRNFITSIVESESPIKTFVDGLKKLPSTFKNALKGAKDLFDDIDFSKWKENSETAIEKVKGLLSDFVEFVIGENEKLELKDILSVAAGVTTIMAVNKFTDAFSKIGDMASAVKTAFSTLNTIFKAKTLGNFANNFKAIAVAIALVAASLGLVAMVPAEKLWGATAALGALVVVMGALSLVMANLTKKWFSGNVDISALVTLSKYLIKLGFAMIVMSVALKNIGKSGLVDEKGWNKTLQAISLLVSMAAAFAGLAVVLSSIQGPISVGVISLVSIAAAFILMSYGITALTAAIEAGRLSSSTVSVILVFAGIISALALVVKVMQMTSGRHTINRIGTQINMTTSWVFGLLGLIASIRLLMETLQELKKFSLKGLGDKWIEIITLIGIIAVMVLGLTAIAKATNFDKSIALLGVGLAGAIGAMYLILLMLERLANNDIYLGDALDAIVWVGIIVAALALAIGAASKLSGGNKNLVSIVISLGVVVVVMGMLTALLNVFKDINTSEIHGIAIAFVQIAVLLSAVMIAIGFAAKLGGGKGIVYIIGIVAIMVTLGAMLTLLTAYSWEELKTPIIAICYVLVVTAVMFAALGALVWAASRGAKIGPLIVSLIALGVVAAALYVLAQYNWTSLIAASGAMATVFIALAATLAILTRVKPNVAAMGSLLVAAVALSGIMIAFGYAMSLLPLERVDAFKEAVTQMLIAVGILMAGVLVLGAIAGYAQPVAIGMAIIAAVLVIVAASVVIFAIAIEKLDGCNLETIANNLGTIAVGLGQVGYQALPMLAAGAAALVLALGLELVGLSAATCANGIYLVTDAIRYILMNISALAQAWNGNVLDFIRNIGPALKSVGQDASDTSELVGATLPARQAVGIQNGTQEVVGSVEQMNAETKTAVEKGGKEVSKVAEQTVDNTIDTITGTVKEKGSSLFDEIGGYISEKISGYDTSQITGMFGQLLGESFAGFDLSAFGANIDTSSITSTLEQAIGGGIGNIDYSSITSGASSGIVGSLTSGLTSSESLGSFEESGTKSAEAFANKFSSYDTKSSVSTFVSNIKQGLLNKKTDMETSGKQLARSAASAFSSSDWYSIGSSAASQIVAGFSSQISQVNTMMSNLSYSSAGYFSSGFSSGIASNSKTINIATTRLAGNIYNGFNKSLGIRSPSKLTAESAGYFVDGFVNKLKSLSGYTAEAVKNSASNISGAFNQYLTLSDFDDTTEQITPVLDMDEVYSKWNEMFPDGVYRPVIKPTLDLSEVNYGMMNARAVVSSGYGNYRSSAQDSMTAQLSGIAANLNQPAGYGDINIQVYGGANSDPNEIAKKVARQFEIMLRRR